MSERFLDERGADVSSYQALGDVLESINDWAGTQGLIYLVIFSLGPFILYSALYRSELVPRLVSISGIIAATVSLVGSILLEAFGESASVGVQLAVAGPIATVEVMLSGWLIAKGFNQSAVMGGQETGT